MKIEYEGIRKATPLGASGHVGIVNDIRNILERRLGRKYAPKKDLVHIQAGKGEDGLEIVQFWLEPGED